MAIKDPACLDTLKLHLNAVAKSGLLHTNLHKSKEFDPWKSSDWFRALLAKSRDVDFRLAPESLKLPLQLEPAIDDVTSWLRQQF